MMRGWLLVLLLSTTAQAVEVRVQFSSRSYFDEANSDAIWNHAQAKLQPALNVVDFKPGFTARPLDVGDGSDGAFIPSRYAQFSQSGNLAGNIIRLYKNEINVTTFELANGWFIEPVNNTPLIIRSLGDVLIRGQIWCHGRSGSDSAGATGGAGGTARCGGYNGGRGGDAGEAGDDGLGPGGGVTGGQGGDHDIGTPIGRGGGGGGSWNTSSPAGDGPHFGVGGNRGTSSPDPEFLNYEGGAGGGGGSGNGTDGGGGGGAGGGSVIIEAAGDFQLGLNTDPTIGFIFANGGAGGDSDGDGGPGAGGGGGSVNVLVGGNITIFNTNITGASQAYAGGGGENDLMEAGATGSLGRSWFSSGSYTSIIGAFYTPAEQAPIDPFTSIVNSVNSVIVTKAVDLRNTLAEITAIATDPVSADFDLEWAGSSDNFVSDDTGWIQTLPELSGKRYIKFRLTFTPGNVITPDMVEAFVITLTPGFQNDFAFTSAGCGRVDGGNSGPFTHVFLLLLPFLILVSLRLLQLRKS